MPRFICRNRKCLDFDKTVVVTNVSMSMSDGNLTPKETIRCKTCGEVLEFLPHTNGIPNLGVFSGMSNEDKRTILRDRADAHKKTLEEEIRFKNLQTAKKLAGLNGNTN